MTTSLLHMSLVRHLYDQWCGIMEKKWRKKGQICRTTLKIITNKIPKTLFKNKKNIQENDFIFGCGSFI